MPSEDVIKARSESYFLSMKTNLKLARKLMAELIAPMYGRFSLDIRSKFIIALRTGDPVKEGVEGTLFAYQNNPCTNQTYSKIGQRKVG